MFKKFLIWLLGTAFLFNAFVLSAFADYFTVDLFELSSNSDAYLPTEPAPDLGSGPRPMGVMYMKEQAAANADTAASGQLWVKNTTPNQLWFTDDAGNDMQISIVGGVGDVVGPASSTDNAIVRFDSTTGKLLQNGVVTQGDNGMMTWTTSGENITAGAYQWGRDGDVTNQMHGNVPTGATFEFSVQDTPEFVLSATQANLQNNDFVTTGRTAFGTGGTFGTDRKFDWGSTITDFSNASTYDHYKRTVLSPSGNVGGGTDSFVANEYTLSTSTAFNFDFANLSANESIFSHDGTGDVTLGLGVFGQAYNTNTGNVTFEQVGGYFVSYNSGNGNISGTIAKAGNFAVGAGTGNFGTGTIERDYTYYAESPYNTGGGTISKHWGLYMEDQEVGNESWAIQTAGGKVEFGAPVGKDPKVILSDGDMTNPITSEYSANWLGAMSPLSSSRGGLRIDGISEGNASGLGLFGILGSAAPSSPAINLFGRKSDGGTGVADLAAGETLLTLVNNDNAAGLTIYGNYDAELQGKLSVFGTNPVSGSGTGMSIAPTLGIMDGSDNYDGLSIALTNANHTGSGNTIQAVNVSGITFDAQATSIAYNISSATGWNYAYAMPSGIGLLMGTAGGNRAEITFDGTDNYFSSTGKSIFTSTLQADSNLVIGTTAAGTSANKVIALSNTATAPSDSTDLTQLYSTDISAGNATLGIFTETAVAADIGLVTTDSLTVRINGSLYKIGLVAVP